MQVARSQETHPRRHDQGWQRVRSLLIRTSQGHLRLGRTIHRGKRASHPNSEVKTPQAEGSLQTTNRGHVLEIGLSSLRARSEVK